MRPYKWKNRTVRLTDDEGLRFQFEFMGKMQKRDLRNAEYRAEDYWINLEGDPWSVMTNNPACMQYALRIASEDNKLWNENVLYGKIGGLGYLIHESEIKELIE